jgi:hypothetical protein
MSVDPTAFRILHAKQPERRFACEKRPTGTAFCCVFPLYTPVLVKRAKYSIKYKAFMEI